MKQLIKIISPLLNDILDAGVFGNHHKKDSFKYNDIECYGNREEIIKKEFISRKIILEKKYTYLKKYPFLLPIAWISRIISYIGNKQQGSGQKTIEIGNQRIELLKKYKIIK